MKTALLHGPGNPVACVTLKHGETVVAQGGSMVAMDRAITVTTTTHQKAKGGITSGVKRLLSGESFFLNRFQARSENQRVWLSPSLPGDITEIPLRGVELVVQGGSYLACSSDIQIDLGWQGLKSMLAGENIFWIQASGEGTMLVNSFGAIFSFDINGEHIIDSGHIVAFEETLQFSVTKAGKSWFSSFLGGEGLVTKFQGRGRVWVQSHHADNFGRIIGPKLRRRSA